MGGMTNEEGSVGMVNGAGGSVLAPIRRGRCEKERVLPSTHNVLLFWEFAPAGIADAGSLKLNVVTWGRAEDGADAGAVTGAPVCKKQLEWSVFLNREEMDATGDELDMSGSRSILTARARGCPEGQISGLEAVRTWPRERAQRARREMRGCD